LRRELLEALDEAKQDIDQKIKEIEKLT